MIDVTNLHHAYVILGGAESLKEAPLLLFESLGMKREGNPDVTVLEAESLGIDDVRDVASRAQEKAFGDRRVFVLKFSRMTNEAQNALLKTLEEPPFGTHFFLLTSDENILLPTLLSRVQKIRLEAGKADEEAGEFLALGYKERLVFAKKFGDSEKNLADFLDELLLLKRKEGKSEDVEKIFKLRKYANDRSSSPRLILEHLALVL